MGKFKFLDCRKDTSRPRSNELKIAQPTTPVQGGPVVLTFENYHAARRGAAPPEVVRLFQAYGAYKVKPHRGSRGLVWNNTAYWWSWKGYYRTGNSTGRRRLLHYDLWEAHHGRPVPRENELQFIDRDLHNFSPSNLKLTCKAEVVYHNLGNMDEEKKILARQMARAARARSLVSLMLNNHQQQSTHESHIEKLQFLGRRRKTFNHPPGRPDCSSGNG